MTALRQAQGTAQAQGPSRADKAKAELAKRELARRRLVRFATYVDRRAAEAYQTDHIGLIADYLERAESGELWADTPGHGVPILIIEAPPRHWKTSTVNKFAAWFVGKRHREERPHQIIMTSYAEALATTNSRSVLDTVKENKLYQNVFPGLELSPNMQAASLWGLKGEPHPTCVATGVGGSLTGQGADCMIVDDPIKGPEDAYSAASRETKWQWFITVALTRINPGGFMVILLTRWHADDLVGRLLKMKKKGDLELPVKVLRLPAIAETDEERESAVDLGLPLDEADPLGREPGEALWPARYSAADLTSMKDADPIAFEALFQGRPGAEGGYLIGRQNFKRLEAPPDEGLVRWVIPSDWAMTEKQVAPRKGTDPDWTAVGLVGMWFPDRDNPRNVNFIIGAVERVQAKIPKAQRMVKAFALEAARRLGKRVPIVAAQDNIDTIALDGLRGDPSMLQWTITNIARRMMKGDKVVKSEPWRSRALNGRVYVIDDAWWRKPWNKDFFVELEGFPRAAKDDQVDMVSAGYHYFTIPQKKAKSYSG